VIEECADLVSSLGRQDVFELAGLLFDFGFAVHGEGIGEETFGKPVPADDVGSALHSARRQFDNQRAISNRYARGLEGIVARIHKRRVMMRLRRTGTRSHQIHALQFFQGNRDGQRAVDFHMVAFRDLSVFLQNK